MSSYTSAFTSVHLGYISLYVGVINEYKLFVCTFEKTLVLNFSLYQGHCRSQWPHKFDSKVTTTFTTTMQKIRSKLEFT